MLKTEHFDNIVNNDSEDGSTWVVKTAVTNNTTQPKLTLMLHLEYDSIQIRTRKYLKN